MNNDLPHNKVNFALSESAQNYILKILPKISEKLSGRGLDLAFDHIGSGRAEKNGKVIWEYNGPFFGFGGRKPEERISRKPYDLLGYTVWMSELDALLLKNRVLALMKVGSPEPHEELVIENAPADYFQKFTQENGGACSCCNPKDKQRV